MVDAIYSSDNITVLGGPSRIDLDLNVGATGSRGSLIFIGDRAPELYTFPSEPQIFDIYINVDSSSSDYLQAFQYINKLGQNVWDKSFKISEQTVRLNKVAEFSSGKASLRINLTELGLTNLPFEARLNSFAYFNVQATASNYDLLSIGDQSAIAASHNPTAFSIVVKDAEDDAEGSEDPSEIPSFLPIDITAVEYAGGSWTAIDGKSLIFYLTITFANPNEILNFGGEA